MNIIHFCEKIGLQPHEIETMLQLEIPQTNYNRWKTLFYENENQFLLELQKQDRWQTLLLNLFTHFAADLYGSYEQKGIDERIYWDTFADFKIWCQQCQQTYGVIGLAEFGWLREHVKERLFKLGSLQFQPYALPEDVEVNSVFVPKHTLVLNVHIPAGSELSTEKVEESFQQALAFFRGIAPIFVCASWLLEPQLQLLLSPTSKIASFQKHFHVYKIDPECKQAEERIFSFVAEEPQRYPEMTSLQKNAKELLLNGGKLGLGYGIKFC